MNGEAGTGKALCPQLPLEMCFTNDVVPRETPLTKAPGPLVSPS